MQVKDLQPKQGKVDIELDVLDIGEAREFQKFGKPGRVATAMVKDETGDVKLTLWNEEIDGIKGGDKIKITNGYVSEWQGELQLSAGRFGKIEKVGDATPLNQEPVEEQPSEPAAEEPKKEPNAENPDIDEEDVI